MRILKIIIIITLLVMPMVAIAHGGRTDKYGCHNDRKNGGYHCHNGGSVAAPQRMRSIQPAEAPISKASSLSPQQQTTEVKERNAAAYKDLVLQTQKALNQLGYSAGEPDGILGKQTIKAIQHFQVDNEIKVDGKPSYLLLDSLLRKIE